MSTATRHAARLGRGGLLARLRSRVSGWIATRLVDRERGDALVETLIAMAVIGITVAAFVSSAQASNRVQRLSLGTDVVAQQAQGVLEQAQSQPWNRLGFSPSVQTDTRSSDTLGRATVKFTDATSTDPDAAVQPYIEGITTRGVRMDQRVDITWDNALPSTTPAGAYGTKVITVTIVYTIPGNTEPRTKVYTAKRTSSVAEAIPALSSVAAADVSPVREPASVCPSVSRSGTTLSWAPVKGAFRYKIYMSGPSTGTYTVAAPGTSWSHGNVGNSGYSFRVVAVWGDGWESTGC